MLTRGLQHLAILASIALVINILSTVIGLFILPGSHHVLLVTLTLSNALFAVGIYLACRAIQRQLQSTVTLFTASRQQRAMLEAIPDIIFVVNDKGELIDHQSRQLHQQGVDFSPWLGSSLEDLIPEAIKPLVVEAFERAVSSQTLQMIEFEVKLPPTNNELRAYELRIVPYEPERLLAILRDITTHKRAREQTVALELERERVRLVTTFIRNTSHEFRTPLAIIGSSADLLTRIDDPQARNVRIERIREQISIITALLDALVLMTRLESGMPLEKYPEDLAEVVKTLVLKLTSISPSRPQPRRQIDFSVEQIFVASLAYPMYSVMINRLLMNTALENLLTHMLQSGDQRTPLRILLHPLASDSAIAAVDFSNPSSDLPQDDVLRYMVERLYRSDEPTQPSSFNYSLGLAVARKIIELHGGRIDLVLMPENRTSLSVQLPLMRQ